MYLLGKVGGYHYQAMLWKLWHDGKLALHDLSEGEIGHLSTLMRKYQDTPMDLADASLLVAAESHKLSRIFTIDGHFRLYRMADGSVLAVVP
jgi:predicted nucleic acid-binding protein